MIIKRPFGAAPAAAPAPSMPRRRPRCPLGAGGPPRVPPPACWGGRFKGDSTRIAKGILHARREERHLRGTHGANEPTPNGIGLGNPIERCLASTGRGKRRRVGRALQMAENCADHLDLGDGGDNAQHSLTAKGTRGHIQRRHTP